MSLGENGFGGKLAGTTTTVRLMAGVLILRRELVMDVVANVERSIFGNTVAA